VCELFSTRKKLEMRHVFSLISSACVFPRAVAQRIRQLDADHSGSRQTKQYVTKQLRRALRIAVDDEQRDRVTAALWDLWPFTMQRWHSSVLNHRITDLRRALDKCVDLYGESAVLF
jgi:hypothetical protein